MSKQQAALAAALLSLPFLALAQHNHDHGTAAQAQAKHATPAKGTVDVVVTGEGFVPARIHAKKGEKLRLVVTRKTDRTCATEIVIKEAGVNQKLPLDKPVVVELTPKKAGKLRYACGMDMIAGEIVVD